MTQPSKINSLDGFFESRRQDEKKPHLSISQIKKFLTCPRMWGYRYRMGIKSPWSGALLVGATWHDCVEANYSQKIVTGKDLPMHEMTEMFVDRWDLALQERTIVLQNGENLDDLREMGVRVTECHHREIAPFVHPEEVETWFDLDLGSDFPFALVGRYDVIEPGGVIVDCKSYKKRPSQADIDRDVQFTGYALAYRATRGQIEDGFRVDIVLKKKKPEAVQMYTSRSESQVRWFLDLIERVAHAMRDDQPLFPNPNGWHCSEKFCDYWSKCQVEKQYP